MSYSGPKDIVILGGGIAGLAAADAITKALAEVSEPLPPGLKVTLVEGEADPGGRAVSWSLADANVRALHPNAPYGTFTPHGIHFAWHAYEHFFRLVDGLTTSSGASYLSPAEPVATYCAWLAPPDVPGGPLAPPRVVALHVTNPHRPDDAWDPRARALLRAFKDAAPGVEWLERFLQEHFRIDVEVDDWLSFADILFNEEHLSPQLRWGMFLAAAAMGEAGQIETNLWLEKLLGQKPYDVELGALLTPFFEQVVVPRMRSAHDALAPYFGIDEATEPQPGLLESIAAQASSSLRTAAGGLVTAVRTRLGALLSGTPLEPVGDGLDDVADAVTAVVALLRLLVQDAAQILAELPTYDPRRSGYLKNVYKAAFSSPFGLDVATGLRDLQFGHRNYRGARLQVFDGDDARGVWRGIRARIQKRFDDGLVPGEVKSGVWAKAIHQDGAKVKSVALSDTNARPSSFVPTVKAGDKGATTEEINADVVVSSLLPQCLYPLLDDVSGGDQQDFKRRLKVLSKFMNETVNLQLFFPDELRLPLVDPPASSTEQRPFSISNLEGIFTILVDLKRAWSKDTFESIRLNDPDPVPFTGTAWELVGAWADVFSHDGRANPGRYQWPVGIQEVLRHLAQHPEDYEPWSVDPRTWVVDTGAPGRLAPPVFGEVKETKRASYVDKWMNEVTPVVVSQTLLQIAALPGLEQAVRDRLTDYAEEVAEKRPTKMRWVLTRSCHAENKFFSAEPGLYELRPHARYEVPVEGLWCCGDWTRNGVNLQAMEGAVVSGLQAAYGVIEALRAGGLASIKPPWIDPNAMPEGAWDMGP